KVPPRGWAPPWRSRRCHHGLGLLHGGLRRYHHRVELLHGGLEGATTTWRPPFPAPQVRSREDGRLYAVKRTLEPFRGAADRRRKLAEVRKHERVGRHPHCLGLVRAWEERGQLYLQSELCPGGPLRAPGDGGGLASWRATAYLWDLLQALGHLHAKSLAHLDVKPANVLLGPGGCRLGDFGCLLEPGGRPGDGAEGDPRVVSGAPDVAGGHAGAGTGPATFGGSSAAHGVGAAGGAVASPHPIGRRGLAAGGAAAAGHPGPAAVAVGRAMGP
uniref:non-specific serine/threonine protein kinase n=1 Tax=Apteryx owenii TaxID=8824 RepID=A0A8B9PW92_APTOW